RGDAGAERAALQAMLDLDPSNIAAWGRLAELEFLSGEPEEAKRLRKLKARLDQARFRYGVLFQSGEFARRPLEMAELAEVLGLRFAFDGGTSAIHQLPETMSGGVGLIDADGDGFLDVFALQGGSFPPAPGRIAGGDRLFHNRGDGTFEDATARSGLGGKE